MTTPEDTEVRRLGEQGFASPEQIREAEEIRTRMIEMGLRPRSVAEILVEKGILEQEDLEALQREDHAVEGRDEIAGYELLELLGRGALGAVYKARQRSLDRVVAIKVLDPERARQPGVAERFRKEARAVARLSHTNLVSGIDVGEEGGISYLVMEYADGVTIARVLGRGGAMDEERALLVALQATRALEYAHKQGIVHGEVRPDNVIVTRDGVAKLCDLGISRGAESQDPEQVAARSPEFLSPEQARGLADVGPAADLYALGATLFAMLTGRAPFLAASRDAIVAKHLTEPAPPVRSLAPDVSAATEAIVARCLAKRPQDRPPDATALAADLDAALKALKAERAAPAPAAPAAAPTPRAAAPAPSPGGAPVPRRRRRH